MFSPDDFAGAHLVEGLRIASVLLADRPIEDLFGQLALGKTRIVHRELHILILAGLSDREKSVTLYHEVLESASVAVHRAPPQVSAFLESDFEREA